MSAPRLVGREHIPGLDGVRALSILIVMAGHYGFGKIVPGGFGVTIFFFVSGFLITTLLLRELDASGGIDLRNFYLRRLLRLAPELLAFVLVTLVVGLATDKVVRPVELLAAVFYFTNYYHLINGMCSYDVCVGWHILWSLAVEEHFYLLFPLCLLLLARNPRRLLYVLTGLLVAALVWRLVVVLALNLDADWTYKASDSRLDSIGYGCWLAVVFARFPAMLAKPARHGYLIASAAAGLLVASLAVRDPVFRDTARYSVQGVAIGLGFLALYATPVGTRGLAFLDTAPMVWMGRLSFAAYLWHFMPLDLFLWWLDHDRAGEMSTLAKWPVALVSTVVTFGLAWLSYVLIARPVSRLRHRFRARGSEAGAVVPAAPASMTGLFATDGAAGSGRGRA
ncbi:acyltransferase family protein [Methylobacterium trifolii]|uniref:acyltransferase family protein n=1 Tax=Methylobacterium trifolii TaxID=1003092 RepID=UPI001EDF9F1D|nr:acyltransferase [Methylobacterium trifolii]